MPKMKANELSSIVGSIIQNTTSYNSEFMRSNEETLKRYNQEPYGSEEDGFSKVVASDVRDLVDSDMTSLVRVFLGSGNVMTFDATGDGVEEVKEALEKTTLVSWYVVGRPEAYPVIHGFLKDAERQKMGVVHYFVDDVRTTREELKKDVTVLQLDAVKKQMMDKDDSIERIDIVEKEKLEGDKFNIRLRVTVSKKELIIKGIPTEDFLITRNSSSLDDAQAVGHQSYPTRSELVASGMTEDEVREFPTASSNSNGVGNQGQQSDSSQSNNMKDIRWRDEGGDIVDSEAFSEWSNQTVSHVLLFASVDFDGDGIAERRRIVKIGQTITENDPYDHIPYAMTSCIMEPHKAIGQGRAELVLQDQSANTELQRGYMDNIQDVANQRDLVGNDVNTDDYLDNRRSGIVRMKAGSNALARDSIVPITIPFIGQEILLIKQARDQDQAARTGTLLASQGLTSDNLNDETAARFNGVQESGQAKIELVARNIAEVGFRKLYDGVAWTLQRFMDREIKIAVNGKAISVTPSDWKFDTVTKSQVGLGAGAGDKAVNIQSGIYAIQTQLKAGGSTLVDDQKLFNTLDKMMQGLGESNTSEAFNNPDVPQEMLMPQIERLTMALQQSQQQIEMLTEQATLTAAATVEAQGRLALGQEKNALDAAKFQSSQALDAAKFEASREDKQIGMIQDTAQFESEQTRKYTEMELTHNVDIPNEGANG